MSFGIRRVAGCLGLVVVTGLASAACLDAPRFSSLGDGTTQPPTRDVHDGMVLLPATTLGGNATLAPTDEGDGNGNGGGDGEGGGHGHGGGGGKGGGGGTPPPADAGGSPPASPTLVVASFWIDAREVGSAEFAACVAAGACAAATCTTPDDHPVACVSLDQARAYCAWRNKRLLRDDEWTAAAAGAGARRFPWGAAPPSAEHLDACGTECAPSPTTAMYPTSDGWPQTAPRGSFRAGATPEGVFDLAGNVAEWVAEAKVRGGSYADVDLSAVLSTASRAVDAASALPTIGFRCGLDP